MIIRNKLCIVGLVIVMVLFLAGLLAPLIAGDPYKRDMENKLAPPSIEQPFGTDQLGRSLFSRVIYGARVSLFVAIAITTISMLIGSFMGTIGGYFGGFIDDFVGRIIDVFLSIPGLILNIALVGILYASFGPSIWNIIFAIMITDWAGYARIARSSVLSLKEREFILAARAMGADDLLILFKHIVPNFISGPILVLTTLNVGGVIMTVASLGFLGLGIQPPTPEWGQILNSGKSYITTAPWIVTFPGLAIALAILGFNLLGEGLRDALDPRLRHLMIK